MDFALGLQNCQDQAWQASARAKVSDRPMLRQKWLQLRAISDVALIDFGGGFPRNQIDPGIPTQQQATKGCKPFSGFRAMFHVKR